MIRRILRNRRPAAPSLVGISLEEELALLRVELMYGLRVNREAYLRRKVDEREELRRRDPMTMLADLRTRLDRIRAPQGPGHPATVVPLHGRRHLRSVDGPGTA